MKRARHRGGLLAAAVGLLSAFAAERPAAAQQHTFQLDRLQMPGAPDDGVVLFRPGYFIPDAPTFFAQLGIGYQLNPLRTSDITSSSFVQGQSSSLVITDQLSSYMTVGFEFLGRFTAAATLPVAWVETGDQPNYGQQFTNSVQGYTTFATSGPAVGDTRLDLRGRIWDSDDKRFSVGADLAIFFPTGNGSTSNFGGDGYGSWMPMVMAEYRIPKLLTIVANTGFQFRHVNSINDPQPNNPLGGLGVSNEWRWAVGVLLPPFRVPIIKPKVRFGATIFGQTGLTTSDPIVGATAFTSQNSPIEWNAEMRTDLSILPGGWIGGSVGTRITGGYGAPDLRVVLLAGMAVPIIDTHPPAPPPKLKERDLSAIDTDHDGIPDDIDACPTEPEDHLDPDPYDGCPKPADRDGDGIPDSIDKCPDVPEDMDGIDDYDGCPEDDADQDGIPDTEDACPKEPGPKNADPAKNGCPQFIKLEGSTVRILEQVHFATGSDQILPDSFPMLTEIQQLLNANPTIKKLKIEGHTDNRGDPAMNLDLSKRRAASVRAWLVGHTVAAERLDSEGYGLTRPIASNATDEGRQANRRVEFKITEEEHPQEKVDELMHPSRKKGGSTGAPAPAPESSHATQHAGPAPAAARADDDEPRAAPKPASASPAPAKPPATSPPTPTEPASAD